MSVDRDFANLSFKAECSRIQLTRAGEHPITVHGPGELWQNADGQLEFKVFMLAGMQDLLNELQRPRPPGQLIPEGDFLQLEANEYGGRVWNASHILPSWRGGLQGQGIVHGVIDRLSYSSPLPFTPTTDYVEMRLKGLLKFPCNSGTSVSVEVGGRQIHSSSSFNAALLKHSDYTLEIHHEDVHTVVRYSATLGSTDDDTPLRIQESLQFILGVPITILVTKTFAGGGERVFLTSPFMSKGSCRMPPPIHFQSIEENGPVWALFHHYFAYVRTSGGDGWHPISKQIGAALESSAASLDAEVLGLAVATEGLAEQCFPTYGAVSGDTIQDIDTAMELLSGLDALPETLRPRLEGALNAMRRARNSDRIREYLRRSGLPITLYRSWSSLRHVSAHGGGAGGRNIIELLRLREEVIFLFYSMILSTVGYSGVRTDYSALGWPCCNWPLPTSEENEGEQDGAATG